MTLRDMKLCVFALAGATVPAWRNKKRSELKEILEGGVDGVREMRAKLKEDTSAQMKMLGWELASPAPPPPPPPPAPSKTSDLTTSCSASTVMLSIAPSSMAASANRRGMA